MTGDVAPAALAETGVPVVLDGAQGVGAVPVDVRALGCAAYAAAGQKWLCGADGTGFLWIDPAFAERVQAVCPAYVGFADPARGLDSPLKAEAARYDTPSLPREAVALSLAALELLEAAGWEAIHARAAAQAAELAARARRARARGGAARTDDARVLGGPRPPRPRATA